MSVGEGGGEGDQAMGMEEGVNEAAPTLPARHCGPMRGSWERQPPMSFLPIFPFTLRRTSWGL